MDRRLGSGPLVQQDLPAPRGVREADRPLQDRIHAAARQTRRLASSTLNGYREDVRRAARRLAAAGQVRWTQNGHPDDPSTACDDVDITAILKHRAH